MSERVEGKLQTVVLAQYVYRHEAEFAAGFLDEAGIPYRLQVDDPAMGMTIAVPATLWVRSMDLRAARDVLDLPADEGRPVGSPPAVQGRATVGAVDRDVARGGTPLTLVERVLAALRAISGSAR